MKTVCLVTNGHISCNPRIVKEADALSESGYTTIVISAPYLHSKIKYDYAISQTKTWLHKMIIWNRLDAPILHTITGIKHAFFRCLPRIAWPYFDIAEKALGRITSKLTRNTIACKADLYIAHNLPALPAAARAAKMNRAKLGFDAEDFHSQELARSDKKSKLIEFIETKFLCRCDYVTSASEPIAKAYVDKYNIKKPKVIFNVFPLTLLQNGARVNEHQELRLYWFSQTIGPGRGIEDIIRAMGRACGVKAILYLQGLISSSYRDTLFRLATENDVDPERIRYLQACSPDELFKVASKYDVGLALERREPLNRDLTITNKIFTYLLAGLSIIASNTQGQASIIKSIGKAGWLYDPGDVDALAKRLEFLSKNRRELESSREEALRQAIDRYNWDLEKKKFLAIVRDVLQTQ